MALPAMTAVTRVADNAQFRTLIQVHPGVRIIQHCFWTWLLALPGVVSLKHME